MNQVQGAIAKRVIASKFDSGVTSAKMELGAIASKFGTDTSQHTYVDRRTVGMLLARLRQINKECGGTGCSGEPDSDDDVDVHKMTPFERERWSVLRALKATRNDLLALEKAEADANIGGSRRDAIVIKNRLRAQLGGYSAQRQDALMQAAMREGRAAEADTAWGLVNKTVNIYKQRFAPPPPALAGAVSSGVDNARPSRRDGLAPAAGGGGAFGGVPTHLDNPDNIPLVSVLEDDEFKQLFEDVRRRDSEMDAIQDELIVGVRGLGQKALGMRDEIAVQETLIDEIDSRVEQNTEALRGLAPKLDKAIQEVRTIRTWQSLAPRSSPPTPDLKGKYVHVLRPSCSHPQYFRWPLHYNQDVVIHMSALPAYLSL